MSNSQANRDVQGMRMGGTDGQVPIKVLWVSCVGEKGGAEVYMINLLRHLDRRRFEPMVVLLRRGPLKEELEGMGVRTFDLPEHRMRNVWGVLKGIMGIIRLIRRQGIQIIHPNGFRAQVYGGLASWWTRTANVWLVHTAEKPGWSTRAILKIPSDQVMANCPRTENYFKENGFRTHLVWPSVDPEELGHATGREALARRFGIPAEARWVCQAARMQRYKGHEYFLRGLAALPESLSNVHGVIIGGTLFNMEPTYPDELKALAKELGIAERVHFTGFLEKQQDLHGFLASCEMLVHPALDEDFGLSVAEAQALGKPVLAFAAVGPAAIIKEGETGRVVGIEDQQGFNTALKDLLSSPDLLHRMGEFAALDIPARFGAVTATQQMERIYQEALHSRSKS